MTRNVCYLALTCLFAACVPPKAVVVEETPLTKPKQTKPQSRPTGDESAPQLVVKDSAMLLPDVTQKLPDRKDMTPTAVPPTGGSPTAIATPPKE